MAWSPGTASYVITGNENVPDLGIPTTRCRTQMLAFGTAQGLRPEQLREAKPWADCRDVNTVIDENPGGMPTVRIMEGAARLVSVLH